MCHSTGNYTSAARLLAFLPPKTKKQKDTEEDEVKEIYIRNIHWQSSMFTGTFQTIAQNFFLQINTISVFFSTFSSKCDSTSHKNFGARSWILDVMVSSSLMIINPCTLAQHNSESYATSNRKKLQEIYFGGPTKQKEFLLNGLKLSTIGFEHQVLNHL